MGAQTVSTCVVCGALADAFLCGDARRETGCLGLLMQRLGDCAWLSDQLSTTLSRQDKVSAGSVGFVTGTAEKPLPVNLGASDAAANLRDKLCSWVRCLWEDNTSITPHCSLCHVQQRLHAEGPEARERDWYDALPAVEVEITITSTSRWLMRHPSWIALNPAVDELYGELSEAVYLARRAVDVPVDNRVFVGKCGFEFNDVLCGNEIYARPGADEVSCGVCGTEWLVEERLDWLRSLAEDEVMEIPALSRLLARLGFENVTDKAIRSKAQAGAIKAIAKTAHGRSTFRVGDVMDVFMTADEPVAA